MTLYSTFNFWVTRSPDRLAVKTPARSATWRELENASAAIAAGLAELGVGHGDAVGLMLHNGLDFIESLLAVQRLGGRATLLNYHFTPRELVHPISDAAIGVVITEPEHVAQLDLAREQFPRLHVILTGTGGADAVTLDQLRARGGSAPVAEGDENDTALICYSSGTTGFPKGVMLSHRNIREGYLATAIPCGFTPNDRVLISAPLVYTWGVSQYLRESLLPGITATIVDPSAGIDELIDRLIADKITLWSAVPVFFERIAASPRFAGADFSNLRHCVSGGSSLHLLQQWQGKGVPLTQAFGMTETGGGHVAMLPVEYARERIGWAGRPLLGVEMQIADDEGNFLPPDTEGEILVSGPMVMLGYLNNPEETAKAIFGNWLRTGDVGIMDDQGFLKVTGRKKDMLRSGGINVYPAELERILAGIRGLGEFAIIGVRDEKWGEVPMIITNDPEEPDIEALAARCLADLAGFKRPKYLHRYGRPLPRTLSGKIMKQALRAEFSDPPEGVTVLSFRS